MDKANEALKQISKMIYNPSSMTQAKHQLSEVERIADQALNSAKLEGGENE